MNDIDKVSRPSGHTCKSLMASTSFFFTDFLYSLITNSVFEGIIRLCRLRKNDVIFAISLGLIPFLLQITLKRLRHDGFVVQMKNFHVPEELNDLRVGGVKPHLKKPVLQEVPNLN